MSQNIKLSLLDHLDIIVKYIDQKQLQVIKVKEFMSLIKGENSYIIALILFSFIPALPFPSIPVLTSILGVIIAMIFYQLLLGYEKIWLPSYINNINLKKRYILVSISYLKYFLEKYNSLGIKIKFFPISIRIISMVGIFSTIFVILPLPFSDTLPSIGILVMAFGKALDDNFLVFLGLLFSIAVNIVIGFIYLKIIIFSYNFLFI